MEDWREDSFFAHETDYNDFMSAKVSPWVQRELRPGSFAGKGGLYIHYFYDYREDARATIVLSHGFCEFVCKYHELMYYFSQAGFNVFFLEHRGFGYSARLTENKKMAHVESFDDYVEDMRIFVNEELPQVFEKEEQAWGKAGAESKPLYLFGHSMGGCIAALYAERYPNDFDKVVLCSPMLSLSWGGASKNALRAMFIAKRVTSGMESYMPGYGDYVVGHRDFIHSSSQSLARYEHTMSEKDKDINFQTNGGSNGWGRAAYYAMDDAIKNADRITAPTIIFAAGKDNMVTSEGQEKFVEKNPAVKYRVFPESKHELFNSTDDIRIPYIREVIEFLG